MMIIVIITDDVRDVKPVGESARGAVRGEVYAVGRGVGARRGQQVVVVAVVHEGVAKHEEGPRRGHRCRGGGRRRQADDDREQEESSVGHFASCPLLPDAWRG
jgi:hypothetical protein